MLWANKLSIDEGESLPVRVTGAGTSLRRENDPGSAPIRWGITSCGACIVGRRMRQRQVITAMSHTPM